MTITRHTSQIHRLALINICLGQFMGALDSRAVTVALPTLSIQFGASIEVLQWIPLAYQLTVIGLVLSIGRLGDMLGRKKLYNLGFVLFSLGSGLCGLATSIVQMIMFRIFEALGAAMLFANGRAIVSAMFAAEGRGKALGITSMAYHLGFIVGPSLGGLLIDTLGWRWVFFVNLPVGLAGAIMAWKVLPETVTQKSAYNIDLPGMVTLLVTVVVLILGLQEVTRTGLTLFPVWLFILALAAGGLFILVENKRIEPLLDLDLFRVRLLTAGIISQFTVSLAQTSTFFLIPFYLQGILAFSPTQVGVTMIVYSVVIVFIAPLGGWLSDRLGSRLLCTTGSFCTFLSILYMMTLDADSRQMDAMLPLMGMGFGWALFASPNLSAIFGSVASERLGAVSGLTVTAANVGNAIGVSLASLCFVRWLGFHGTDFEGATTFTEWTQNPESYLYAFQNSWAIFALFALMAVIASSVRGAQK